MMIGNVDTGETVWLFLGAMLVFTILGALISLSAAIPPIRKLAQEERSVRITISFVLGFLVCVFAFFAITRWISEAYYDTPPHGVLIGVWEDLENYDTRILFVDEETGSELSVNDAVLAQITLERFRRYMLAPPFRHHCFTGNKDGCLWADIDLSHFEDKQEWIDFFIRVTIGSVPGLVTSLLVWLHTERKETLQLVTAG
jgi:hypothetical protein